MAAIVTHKFRIHNAEQFYESFSESAASTYYLYIGRPQAFSTTTGGGTDGAPPTPNDSMSDEYDQWREMLAAKKITTSDIQFVVPRRNWTSGTTYDIYRPDYSATVTANSTATNLFSATYYVMTSDYLVYKCMGNDGNTASTVEPTSTSNTEAATGDGYVWKYMYTLTSTQTQNFLSTDFLPVIDTLGTVTGISASTVSAAAVDGELRHIAVTTAGSGYTNGSYTGVAIKGDGSNGVCTVVVSGNALASATVTTQGTGYTFATIDVANITSIGGGSNGVLTPLVGPKGGHGKDALRELGAFFVMLNTSLSGEEGSGDFIVGQDFRRVGLVRNPYNYGTTTVSSSATLSALKNVTFAASPTPGTFTADEIITGGTSGAKGKVAYWNAATRKLYYIQTQWTGLDSVKNMTAFAGTEVVTGTDSSAQGTMSSANNPELDYHSGDVMYIENRVPITRASDQTENIKLVIEF
jgi:hypothetical protein